MDSQLIPNKKTDQPAQIRPGTTTVSQLAFLCQDEGWLLELIQDTEANQMIAAPTYIEAEILSKAKQPPHPFSNRLKLIYYSLKVSLAAAGTILVLFTAPFFLEQPMWKTTPPVSKNTAFQSSFPFDPAILAPRAGRKLKEDLWQLSGSIYEISNEFLQGGNLHD